MAQLYDEEIYGYQATEIYNLIMNVEERENKRDSSLTTYCRVSDDLRKCDFEMIAKDLIENCYDYGEILVLNEDGVLLKVSSISSENDDSYYLNISIDYNNDSKFEPLIEISKIIFF
jgi:hypothetical protein